MQTAALDAALFLVCFAFGYLVAGKGRVLTLSTRAVLVVLVALAAAFALSDASPYRPLLGAAAVGATVLFVAFVTIDVARRA